MGVGWNTEGEEAEVVVVGALGVNTVGGGGTEEGYEGGVVEDAKEPP